MNTNQLKRFAKDTRIKLIEQVSLKMEFVLTQDSSNLRGKEKELEQLKQKIQELGKTQLIETVAYTWFNRLMALRFMDANNYTLPKVITPLVGMSNPEILQNALAGNVEADLLLDRQRLNDILDGRVTVADAHTEAYKMLLVAVCNFWHKAMPFMFERISDYTELLLPDDLLSDFSIVADIRKGMSEEDCQQEEVIGWLYQFYIAEKKDQVFEGLKKNIKITAENIPAATQLFTPRWIVRYMVENTLGKLWLTIKPNSKLREYMPYYIESPAENVPTPLPEGIKQITDIRFLDPCMGSGHVLVYAFDLFAKIYEEEGYNTNEIPALILQHNLFGIDIDPRAAQLAAFALSMKARNYYSRFLRKPVQPNVIALQNVDEEIIQQSIKLPISIYAKKIEKLSDLSLHLLTQANNFGSLIQIEPKEVEAIQIQQGSIWQEQQILLKLQASYLSQKYHCVVTNPPYMGGGGMNDILKKYLDKFYSISKADLMTCFMQRAMELCHFCGYWGMINLPSWMFLSTFDKFREMLIRDNKLDTMLHLGRGIFGSDFGSVAFTTQLRQPKIHEKGIYRRLFKEHVQVRSVETIHQLFFDKKYGYYLSNQKDFEKIPGSPIGYWLSEKIITSFDKHPELGEILVTREGMATSDNNRFLKIWSEVILTKIGFNLIKSDTQFKWYPYNKGGAFRKWYGNNIYIVNYENDGFEIKNNKDLKSGRIRSHNYNGIYAFQEGLTWSALSSGPISVRYSPQGYLFDSKGAMGFTENIHEVLALINSKVTKMFLSILAPTLDYKVGDIIQIPYIQESLNRIDLINLSKECTTISKSDWNSRETSWEFQQNELIKQQDNSLKKAFENYTSYWTEKFYELHHNEEELNRQFIEIYGLQDELTPDVPLQEITILQEEAKIIDGQLFIDPIPVLLQLLSYSVGCMFGRYSLNKEGLILANQGESLEDYLAQILGFNKLSHQNPLFMPDEDNIIPVLEGEWFLDDIVGRFKAFLRTAFGESHFEENLRYIEETLDKDIRKYFVKDFYNDHIKRYKKRPIYWMFSSPKGHFKALIYLHRYQPDTCSKLLNDYLQPFIAKLEAKQQSENSLTLREDISAREKALALKEMERIEMMLKDCKIYERNLYTVATQRIEIDLDDGVKVNYQKLNSILIPIKGLEKEEE